MGNPPHAVKLALESICLLLGEQAADWRTIRGVIIKDNFISTIVNFSTEDISDDIRKIMVNKYLSNPDYNFEKVNRASLACGPLVKWSIAQISYADMLTKVDPLRNELQSLEIEAQASRIKSDEISHVITELEKSIARYKEEYAALISQAQAIKTDLASVEAKVSRSTALLRSLSVERQRWETGSNAFQTQMGTIVGDVLLSSAFLAYAGYFDQQLRQNLFTSWASHLQQANIQFRPDIARVEYLSSADERLQWQANSLPADDLCTENAIMLKRFNRYPLIIDPSGQATEFLLNEYKGRKINKTSFLDDAFRKNLESALRFGNPLLVQDVESYDPIVNPVLNRELRRTGGRVLITLGDQDIDLSPSFTIFLSTRDPTVEFAPDLCSRVTFVNFTVTRSSLQSQCLNQVLKAERPDVDKKRSDLLKLQGEFHLRLRYLEKSLLQALNDAKGRILDDDRIIATLEKLKEEAAEITRKVEETDVVMAEIEAVSDQYGALSHYCSSIYFTMEGLNLVHFLYQFSLQFFLDIFQCVLYENPKLKGMKDPQQRLKVLSGDLFQIVYNRVARGMLHDDRITFSMLLCRIYLRGLPGESEYDDEFEMFLRGGETVLSGKPPRIDGLAPEQATAVVRLSKLPAFKELQAHMKFNRKDFFEWLESGKPERSVPICWDSELSLSNHGQVVHQLLVIQALRPDRLLAMGQKVVATILGENFMHDAEQGLDLASVVEHEVKASTPMLMCSVPGYDASGWVDDLAAEQNKQCTSIAIGSAEGFSLADKAINSATKSGRWVLLKNVHLAPQWLVTLEKKLHTLNPHSSFRLFMTMEINPKVPVNLLRASRLFVFEPPPGVKANLLRTFSAVPAARMCKAPSERARLYFLLAWFHAIVQERLRYVPLGWSKRYEFSESDLRVACDTLDTWLDAVAQGRTNLPPNKVPWDAIQALLSQAIYGGRIDNDFDQRLMTSFVNRLFTVSSFESDFPLVLDVDGEKGKKIVMPEGIRREQFLQWIEALPDAQSPSWLGLPNNAEKVLLTTQGQDMVTKLLKMQMLSDDDELAYSPDSARQKRRESDPRPAWMRTLHTTASNWLNLIPKDLTPLKRTLDNIKDPLFRYFEREVNTGYQLLTTIREDLNHMVLVCESQKKPTNYLRQLMSDLVKGILPSNWRRYTVPTGLTVLQWVADFSDRVKQLQKISHAANTGGAKGLKNLHIWLGGMFVPEAYITATRQFVAQANNWSLEELALEVNIANGPDDRLTIDDCSFGIKGLRLQGARCQGNKLELTATISTDLALTSLKWIRVEPGSAGLEEGKVTLPVYLNHTRTELLFTVDMTTRGEAAGRKHRFYERGVAFLASSLSG
ncbi:Cytoplasmic dynein 1 heavy chain 1 [Desmophyllum pertusum]|uniref:Cytoplasmic dynein 1 heavy chain 1 n=1 Tax=Desmophyllum pertusum TaxID=174260 RepID=A0A9W9ZRN7_9CNID|nr:Cytoplasmic dynein 1 heavy chain 1 [Desmophyllum pertusum]